MVTHEENGMKISLKMPHEEVSFGERYVRGIGWVVWAFFGLFAVGILILIVISILQQCASVEISMKDATLSARGLRLNPVLSVISSVGVAVVFALLYGVHCWLVRGIAYEDRKRAKDREDFISGQIRVLKDVIQLPQTQQDQRIQEIDVQKIEIDVRYQGDDSKEHSPVMMMAPNASSESTGDGAQLSSVNPR